MTGLCSIKIALLPLDQLKIKAQTNPESLAGRGVVDIFAKEGRGLYRGAGWTAARNAPGSFALFGGASVVKEYMFRLERPGDATLFQAFVASIAGAVSRCVRVGCHGGPREGGRVASLHHSPANGCYRTVDHACLGPA